MKIFSSLNQQTSILMPVRVYFPILLLAICMSNTFGQKREYDIVLKEMQAATGHEKAKLLIELCNQDVYNDQKLTIQRARQAYTINEELNNKVGMGWSLRYMGLSHHFTGNLDSARIYYDRSTQYYDKPKDKGWAYYNIASIFEQQAKLDSALFYLDLAEAFSTSEDARNQIGASKMMRGNIHAVQGDWNAALPYFLQARNIFDDVVDLLRMADAITEIGNVNAKLENYETSIEYLKEAAEIYLSENDNYYYSQVLSYIGSYYYELNERDSAIIYLNKAFGISKEVNHTYISGNILLDLSDIDIDDGLYDEARTKIEEAINYFNITEDQHAIAMAYKQLGDIEHVANQNNSAKRAYAQALGISEKIDLHAISESIYSKLKGIYKKEENYTLAFDNFEKEVSLKDSLSSLEAQKNMQDLLVQYETEKKEKELIIAKAESDKRAANIKLLIAGLVTLCICGICTIFSIIQNRKKKLAILQKDKFELIQKRQLAEKELEFKQKELAAKVLQLASKNEFLQDLELEVNQLKSNLDSRVNVASERISRMIQYDNAEVEMWEQFSKEFSSIHSDFLQKLSADYGSFTKSEVRLISLLKMNLSSKDIANILRISTDGIKKARYRLRKKMKLDSNINLQGFLLSYH